MLRKLRILDNISEDRGYVIDLHLDEWFLTPPSLFNLALALLKIILVEKFGLTNHHEKFTKKVTCYSKLYMQSLIEFLYTEEKVYVGIFQFMLLFMARYILLAHFHLTIAGQTVEAESFPIVQGIRNVTSSWNEIKKALIPQIPEPILMIFSSLPFTIILYCKYNLHYQWATVIVGL
jgi:hypothetical protein